MFLCTTEVIPSHMPTTRLECAFDFYYPPQGQSYDLRKKTLVAQLGNQTANPGSPDHISGSPENFLQYVLEICRHNILLETLH